MNKVKLIFAAIVLSLMTAITPIKAQDTSMAGMDMTTPSTLIRGSDSPDQIPQNIIFHLWLVNHTQGGKISGADKIGFTNPNDTLLVQTALLSYAKKQLPADAAYNATVTTGDNYNSRQVYWAARYGLVGNLLTGLQASLSADGLTTFNAFLENLKAGAFVSPIDAGFGALAETRIKELSYNASAGMPQGPTGMHQAYSMLFEKSIAITNHYSDPMVNEFSPNFKGIMGQFGTNNSGAFVMSGGSGGTAFAYFNATTGKNQCNSVTLTVMPSVGQVIGFVNRLSTDAQNGYTVGFYNHGDWTGIVPQVGVSGTWTQPVGAYTWAMTVGDVLTACTSGPRTVYLVTHNGVQTPALETYDTQITWGGFSGIMGSAGSGEISNFTSTNGETFNINGTLTGDTICTGTVCNGVYHTGYVHLKVGTLGSIVSGNRVTPQTAITVYNSQSFDMDALTIQPYASFDILGEVLCSAVGNFFDAITEVPGDGNQGGGGGGDSGWYQCPSGGCAASWFWSAVTVATLNPQSQYSSAYTAFNYTLSVNCTPETSPPDYRPPSNTITNWTVKPPPKNWAYYGNCIAPPLGPHAGMFYCFPTPLLAFLNDGTGAPVPAYWLQLRPFNKGWGPFACTYNGQNPGGI